MPDLSIVVWYSVVVVVAFLLPLLLQILVNPSALREEPSNKRKSEIIENRKSWSVGIFAIDIVIANFILTSNQPLEQSEILALASIVLSAVFLMLAYEMEGFAGLTRVFFRAQEYSLEFGGFLLFLSLFFLMKALSPLPEFPWIIGGGIAIILGTWVIRTGYYVFVAQTN